MIGPGVVGEAVRAFEAKPAGRLKLLETRGFEGSSLFLAKYLYPPPFLLVSFSQMFESAWLSGFLERPMRLRKKWACLESDSVLPCHTLQKKYSW